MPGATAIIPIRSLTAGKTRLAGALTPDDRSVLIRAMFGHVAREALAAPGIDRVVVVSLDPEALAFAQSIDRRIETVLQPAETAGLLPALEQGRDLAIANGASALLILFADLPLLHAEDINDLLDIDQPVVLAPDRHGIGTNAMLLRLTHPKAHRFPFAFGEASYARHLTAARRRRIPAATFTAAGTAFDLDTPDDLTDGIHNPGWGLHGIDINMAIGHLTAGVPR